jgi:hypothetical protein
MHGRDAGTAGTADAVARLLPQLGPVAVLLTDDPDGATRLLALALSAPRALDQPSNALHAVTRAAVRRPRWAAEQVIEGPPPVAPPDEDSALADAWCAVGVRDRAAVVLRLVAELPLPALAESLRLDPAGAAALVEAAVAGLGRDLARRDEEAHRERARAAALFRRPGSAPELERPAPDLGERLALLAASRPLPATAAETIAAAVNSAHHARRRRRQRLGAGVLAAGLLVGLSALLPQAPAAPRPVSVYAGPTRGSLAGDDDFLRAVRDSGWELAADTTGSRRVVFAGDVPGGRWALVAAGGSPARPATTAWFVGPAGAAPDRMALLSVRVAPDPAEPVSVTDPAAGALVVVAAPGDAIRVSDRPEVDAGGSITRRFRTVSASRGAAVVGMAPVPNASVSAARLEVTRGDRRLDVHLPTVVADPRAAPLEVSAIRLRPPPPPAAGDAAVAPRLRAVLGQLGEPIGDTPVTALWSGDLPGPNDQPARLTVVAVPQSSGAVVITTPYGYAADSSGRAGSSWCGTGVLPAGIPLEQRVVAVQCDLSDLTVDREISRFLVVIGPRTATSVQLLDASGAVLRERPLDDGVTVVRSPGPVAEVSVTTADGGTSSAIPLADSDLVG